MVTGKRERSTGDAAEIAQRLQKVLAHAGIASRRHAEELITAGRVTVDGIICTTLGTKVEPSRQRIEVDGRPVLAEVKFTIILNKPTSYVTTVSDPEGRRTVMELLRDIPLRLYPVGRLDYDTSGLLLLTNDGQLANRLLHPSHHVEKAYRVTVLDAPDKPTLDLLKTGVQLDDGMTLPAQVNILRLHPRESVLEISVFEGRNRQIRRMCEAVGMTIKRLKRLQFGPIFLEGLHTGEWRPLTPVEWAALYGLVDLAAPPYRSTGSSDPPQQRPVTDQAMRRRERGAARVPSATKRSLRSR